MLRIYILLWLGLLVLAFLNAGIRELGYKQYVTELAAHQISTFTGCVLATIFTCFVTRIWPVTYYSDSLKIGIIWVLLTVVFETTMVLGFMKKTLPFF